MAEERIASLYVRDYTNRDHRGATLDVGKAIVWQIGEDAFEVKLLDNGRLQIRLGGLGGLSLLDVRLSAVNIITVGMIE